MTRRDQSNAPHPLRSGVIQVAGIIDAREARLLTECGVDYLGFPFRLAHHREDISEAAASRIIRHLSPPNYGVLITYLDSAPEISRLCATLGASIVQLHGEIGVVELEELRSAAPHLQIIKSIIIGVSGFSQLLRRVDEITEHVDAFITDTHDPQTGARGATGRTHDWRLSRKIVEFSPRPVILAGGLNPENVRRAIREVRPAGVDVHTGVENAAGRKDRGLVSSFVTEAREAFRGE